MHTFPSWAEIFHLAISGTRTLRLIYNVLKNRKRNHFGNFSPPPSPVNWSVCILPCDSNWNVHKQGTVVNYSVTAAEPYHRSTQQQRKPILILPIRPLSQLLPRKAAIISFRMRTTDEGTVSGHNSRVNHKCHPSNNVRDCSTSTKNTLEVTRGSNANCSPFLALDLATNPLSVFGKNRNLFIRYHYLWQQIDFLEFH